MASIRNSIKHLKKGNSNLTQTLSNIEEENILLTFGREEGKNEGRKGEKGEKKIERKVNYKTISLMNINTFGKMYARFLDNEKNIYIYAHIHTHLDIAKRN